MACRNYFSSSPPLPEKQRVLLNDDNNPHNVSEASQVSVERGEGCTGAVTAKPSAKHHVCKTWSGYLYAGPGQKPRFLKQAESYVSRQLQAIDCTQPKFQELKLQVYREVFGHFIEEFKTYKPLLDAIKKEYENTLASLRDQMSELEPLRDHLRLVTEECNRKIVARWQEERIEIQDLKREKQQMQRDLEDMREKEKAMQAVVAHLQSELSNQYLEYREEYDARKLLIVKLNDLSSFVNKDENTTGENDEGGGKDLIQLKLALKVCREDLKKAQVELNRVQAEYWDVVPRYDWEMLEHTHKDTLQQLESLQGDFDKLKSEYDILLEIRKRDSIQSEAERSVTSVIQVPVVDDTHHEQNPLKSKLLKELTNFDPSQSGTLTVQEFREALRTAFPLKSHEATEELVATAQNELSDTSGNISYHRLYSPRQESDDKDFFSVVKKQSVEEREVFTSQLRAQLEDKGDVSVADLQAALMNIDPSLDSDALVWNLCVAFQVNKEELKQYETTLDAQTIVHRLSVADTSVAEPPPPQQ